MTLSQVILSSANERRQDRWDRQKLLASCDWQPDRRRQHVSARIRWRLSYPVLYTSAHQQTRGFLVRNILQDHPQTGTIRDQQETEPPPVFWTLERLVDACRRKGIDYEETPNLASLQGFAVSCGQTFLISVRANLPPDEKLYTLAHELGHIALGRMYTTTIGQVLQWLDTSLAAFQDTAQESNAHLWAAHLLVSPEVFALCHADAQVRLDTSREEEILASAMQRTAERLGIPRHAVELWYAHQHEVPTPTPNDWLGAAIPC